MINMIATALSEVSSDEWFLIVPILFYGCSLYVTLIIIV